MSLDSIRHRYGQWVADAVEALTQDREAMKEKGFRDSYYQNLNSLDPKVMLIKICDKFDNLFAQCLHPDEARREAYYQEARDYLEPRLSEVAPKVEEWFYLLMEDNKTIGHYRSRFN
jgi:(p)ppGpp synthase/HD superfamily hydrolase